MKCEILTDRTQLEQVSEFKYLGCVLDESGTDGDECHKKVANERKVANAIRSLGNSRKMQLKGAA